ncbi:two-pore potassium channel 3 isoform X1 [Elaeis guineensis]|uniref:Two pore potassium channel c isoform X1 n=1 Tax=Elaeis guineensis var. tenera TaxID=51953 RepID=A0A6I9RBW1_ELAGV|nr:two pore potassium channel c isoform X1 [Elaeis guineensis]
MAETEPLLPTTSPRKRLLPSTPPSSILCPLPEDGEISIPFSPATASPSLKERLIFGSSSDLQSPISPEALSLLIPIPSSPIASTARDPTVARSPLAAAEGPASSSWLTDPSAAATGRSNLHRSRTAPAMSAINAHAQQPSASSPHRPSIVRQAVVLLSIYLSLGVLVYTLNRSNFSAADTHPVVDALYFCIVTMCTIGYGDITPATPSAKLFSITFVLVGFGFIDILLSGMVSYVLDLQESLLLGAVANPKHDSHGAAGGKHHHHRRDVARRYIIDVKKGRMRIRMKVALALGVVVLCIGVGTAVLRFVERLGWLDSFYLSVMSVTTVGYGDRAFKTMPGRLFASLWLLVSTLAVARAFLYLAEARIDKRHRKIAKWVLCRDMTVSEFLAADIDNNGFVTKSEFVIYKLKEMGKVMEKDIMQICDQFDRLDTGKCGKITLSDLIESHH